MDSLANVSVLTGSTNPFKPNYIHRLFEEIAENHKNDVALIFEDDNETRTHTYESLDKITNKTARAINAIITNGKFLPNNDGDYIIAVSMLPSDKFVIAILAIWKSGAAYLPIDDAFPNSRVEYILNEAKPALVLYEKDFDFIDQVASETFDDLLEKSKTFSEDTIKEEDYLKHETVNLAIVFYTSGSTGVPKGVRIPHEIIQNRLQWQFKTFPYSVTEKVGVFKTSLSFVDCVSEIWGPLLNGRSLLVIPKKVTYNPEKLVYMLQKYKIERLVLVPSLLRSLLLFLNLQKNEELLRNLKLWVCASEPLSVSLAQDFFQHFSENEHTLCNFYGSTEDMGDVTYHVISSLQELKNKDKVPIGLPIHNTIIYLLDDDLRPVDIGNLGKIWVSGLNLAAGYVNGRSSERFITNPYPNMHPQYGKLYDTGDYGRIDKETIVYEGRTDSQVKIRGCRVDLSEIERAINFLPITEEGVVLCYQPGDIDQVLLAFVTLKNGCLMNELQVEKMLQKNLSSYMWPQVVILENIPLLINGKIDRQALLKSYENTKNSNNIDYTRIPANQKPAAKILLETVASVLNRSARSAISIDANFYEMGGNSLNSILTIVKLYELGYYISIEDFIGALNLREVLTHMSSKKHILHVESKSTKYTFEMLKNEHKEEVFKMVTDSFYEKGDLEQWLLPEMQREDFDDNLTKIWDALIDHDLSFIAKTESGKSVGVALNLDARDEPQIEVTTKLAVINEFLEYAEGTIRDEKLPQGKGKICHSILTATNASLSPKENVSVIQYMEEEALRIAKSKNFAGIFTTNTSVLTQQLDLNIYGYQAMSDIQVNKYVASDGSKPFSKAPDSQRAIVCWKSI